MNADFGLRMPRLAPAVIVLGLLLSGCSVVDGDPQPAMSGDPVGCVPTTKVVPDFIGLTVDQAQAASIGLCGPSVVISDVNGSGGPGDGSWQVCGQMPRPGEPLPDAGGSIRLTVVEPGGECLTSR